MTAVTNAWVAAGRDRLFANSPGYNTNVDMAGREEALRQMTSVVRGEAGTRCARVSDLLGAGKTFFLQKAINHLDQAGVVSEARDVATIDYRVALRDGALRDISARVLIIDELDRKAGDRGSGGLGAGALQGVMEAAAAWLTEDRILILTGDYTLNNDEFIYPLGQPSAITLEPLEEPLLLRALSLRLAKELSQAWPVDEAQEIARQGAQSLVAPELLRALIPATDPPVATFREVLGIIQELSKYLPIDQGTCVLSAEQFHAWAATERKRARPVEQTAFIEGMHHMIRAASADGATLAAMEIAEFPWLDNPSHDVQEQYERDVLVPLIRAKVVVPLGVPFAPPSRSRTPAPYLPTVRTFLDAIVGST